MIDVSFERVSKRYRIRQPLQAGGTRDASEPDAASGRRRIIDFWALRDVSFEVGRGEALGLVGHTGAGKTTILKLLSQITAPTEGEIRLGGRIAALIEVGSGFHPELTGRENIYLAGSILGQRRRDVQAKLDRIVAFAEVGDFIDTPVKRYSSGMYVRLGFAVAAHLEPDILLVDEVLAAGDAAFQIQCLERLDELRRAGTTLLFVSHDLISIEKLCDRVALMDRGRLIASGAPHEIVTRYQQMTATSQPAAAPGDEAVATRAAARVEAVTFHDERGDEISSANTGEPLAARVHYRAQSIVREAVVELFYYSRDGRVLHCEQSTAAAGGELTLVPGRGAVEFTMPGLGLQPGVYSIGATIRQRSGSETIDWTYGRTALRVEPGRNVRGSFYTPHEWRLVAEHGQGLSLEEHGCLTRR